MSLETNAQVESNNTEADDDGEDGYVPPTDRSGDAIDMFDADDDDTEQSDEEESSEKAAKSDKSTERSVEQSNDRTAEQKDPWETLDRDEKARLLQWSKQFRMTEREAMAFTPNGLKNQLASLAQAEINRQNAAAWQQQQAAQPQQTQQPFKPDWETLTRDYDETLVNNLKGGYEAQAQTIQQLQQQLHWQQQQYEQFAQQQANAAFDAKTERFEGRIEALLSKTPELEKLFGKGTIHDLREGSPEFENRRRLFDEMQRFSPGNGMGPALAEAKSFEKALNATFSSELKEFETQKLADKMRDNAKKATAKPTAHGSKRAQSGLQRAVSIMKDMDRKLDG